MRLALATLNPIVGDLAGNAAKIERLAARARDAGADCVLLPELALCGYPPKDLLLQEGFVRACAEHARRLIERASKGITLVFGTPLPDDPFTLAGPTHNSLIAARDGQMVAFYDKRLLPTYDVFDEDRYFTPGEGACVLDVPSRRGALRVGLSICEDLWKGQDAGFAHRYRDASDPVADLVGAGARVVLSASASPFVLGKGQAHRDILARHARTHKVFVASVNQLGGNDELVFDGHRYVFAPDGSLLAAGDLFRDDILLADLPDAPALAWREPARERQLFDALVLGLRDYLAKTGFKSAIVGLSGGIDSALTAALAAAAIGPANVLGVSMPGPYSSEHSKGDAFELAQRLGVACVSVPLAEAFQGGASVMNRAFDTLHLSRLGASMPDLTEENLQSRLRGLILMTLSNRSGAIVLTTGNKSELAVGYATLYGDMNGGLAVLSDVSKMDVYALSRWINANHHEAGFASPPIPAASITKAPSAELRPNQTDQDSLPPYELLDRVIDLYVEERKSPATIAREAGFEPAVVARITRMIDLAEYKRRQGAIGLKVTSVAFGSGRRMPIAQGWRGGAP
jgi:NAD+ synthetase